MRKVSDLLDFRDIDNKVRPCEGPVCKHLQFNKQPIHGVDIDVRDPQHRMIARSRVYKLNGGDKLQFLITYDEKNGEHGEVLAYTGIAYALMIGAKPEDIIFPAPVYGSRAARIAQSDWCMKPISDAEIDSSLAIVKRLNAVIKQNCARSPLLNLDDRKAGQFDAKVKELTYIRRVRMSDNVRDLLRNV
jgi:hypothetical protein